MNIPCWAALYASAQTASAVQPKIGQTMMSQFTQAADSSYPGAGGSTLCPHCKGVAYRVPRRWIERLRSHWRPLLRYECQTLGCRRAFNKPARR